MIYFTIDEKIKILSKNKFVVKKKNIEISSNVYHNDIEYKNIEVYGVFKNGKEYKKPFRVIGDGQWLDDAFDCFLKEKIINVLCNK